MGVNSGANSGANSGVILALDGGGSKTDAVALDLEGHVMGRARAGGSSPQLLGLPAAVAVIDDLVRELLGSLHVRGHEASGEVGASGAAGDSADVDAPARVHAYLSGLDLPEEVAAFRTAIASVPWLPSGTAAVIDNDMFALLRAGTDEPDAAAVVCGTGINAIGVRADGRTVRFPALGRITGDWGGGWQLGEQALWHAARAEDGRGAATVLTATVPRVFGFDTVDELILALHRGVVAGGALRTACPAVLSASADGDAVARSIVDRQADEIVTMASAALHRLDLQAMPVPVVLGGGVIASGDAVLLDGIRERMSQRLPHARITFVRHPPVVGAALLALQAAGAEASALDRARHELAPAAAHRG